MDREHYLNNLQSALIEKGKSETYVNSCMQYAGRLIDNNLPVIFDTKHLALLIGIKTDELCKFVFTIEERFYQKRTILKKSGGERYIQIPSSDLKYIQRWILKNILNNIKVSNYANGFHCGRSIVTNASKHVGKECLINLDIKDFFPTISADAIFRIFAYYGYTKEISYMLTRLCTHEGNLPQGSPASPYLSNIICLKLDKRLSELAKKYNADYTRYADDITFSGNYGIKKCAEFAESIVADEGFSINPNKTRIAYKHQRQEVTGLVVNQGKISIPRKFRRSFKQELYYCKKYGISEHLKHVNCSKSFYKEHLYGKAYYINMVDSKEGKSLISMLDELDWEY